MGKNDVNRAMHSLVSGVELTSEFFFHRTVLEGEVRTIITLWLNRRSKNHL